MHNPTMYDQNDERCIIVIRGRVNIYSHTLKYFGNISGVFK